ncbi:multicopper oxidase [Xylariales sp. PMI_506]|nr:multicopper oxidase [Xylariales sp. PMI_506]
MFKVNGQFPGPLLDIDEGDDVVIVVKNESPYNTTIHYHGIEMLNTPWSDGVPGVSQNHIQPHCTFTYRWTATQHGTFFYHSHSDSQINDGLYGPIVIHPKADTVTPYSLITSDPVSLHAIEQAEKNRIPLLLSDWRHITSDADWDASLQSHLEHLCFDSILVNGKGNVNCLTPEEMTPLMTPGQAALLSLVPDAQLTDKACLPPQVYAALDPPGYEVVNTSAIPQEIFYGCEATTAPADVISITKKKCDAEKWAMFDLIGAFGLNTVEVSLDELSLTIIAVDANYVEPITADSILITNGQRYTVLVKLEEPKKYTFRVSAISDPQILFATSVIDFQVEGENQDETTSTPFINERGVNLTAEVVFFDGITGVVPYPPSPIPQDVDATYKVNMGSDQALNIWAFNVTHRPQSEDDATPLLFAPQPGLQDNHTVTVPSDASWVDYVMQVAAGQPPHPVHIHGRHFYVLGSGSGAFNWSTVAEAAAAVPESFNLVNPPLRDTYPTPSSAAAASWLVLRRPSDNPGVWLIHCHIMSHLQGGMSMVIQDGTDDLPVVPAEFLGYQCPAQNSY